MFYREEKKTPSIKKVKAFKNMEPVETFSLLLKDKKREELLQQIHTNLAFKSNDQKQLCQPLIEKLACLFQSLPDTSLYYSHRGGLLDRALNRTDAVLNLMRSLLVRKDTELPSEEQKLWLYAVFSAGLLRGVGKLYGEYRISLFDQEGHFLQLWRPLHDDMEKIAHHYSHEFTQDIDENSRKHITLLLAKQLMPEQGLAKISANPKIFYTWLALLEEDRDGAGALSAILDRADAIALQRYLLLYLEEHKHVLDQSNRLGTFLDTSSDPTLDRERVLGAEFLLWIRDALAEGKLLLNKPPMQAEISAAGVVLSSEVFDMFMQEHQKFKNKHVLQRAFNSWTKQVNLIGNEKQQKNLNKFNLDHALLPDSVKIYSNKTNQLATVKTLDLLHDLPAYSAEYDRTPIFLQQLDITGKWIQNNEEPRTAPGTKSRG